MDNGEGQAWNISKDKLIHEIKSTYEAILKFKDHMIKSESELNNLSMEQLSAELQNQTSLLDKLVNDWDVKPL